MRIVIAPDSFKECASALEVATAIAEGVRRAAPHADIVVAPMADGGEGTVDALVDATGGQRRRVRVTGPMGESVEAVYGILGDGETAVIEMAAASGLPLVPPEQRDPRVATTRGTGELMRHALEHGARNLVIGIGGSATNDAGAGMAAALGYRLLDMRGDELPAGGAALARLATIDASGRHAALAGCAVRVACDVRNPLCGPDGASRVYGPQKGATPCVADELDDALEHFARVVKRALDVDVLDLPGAGAAGGLGAGLVAFTHAELRPGVQLVAEASGLDRILEGADLVVTGEGALDAQTVQGKTPFGVAQMAKKRNTPVIALAGTLRPGYEIALAHGIDAAFSICPRPMTFEEACADVRELLANAGEAVVRTFLKGRTCGGC